MSGGKAERRTRSRLLGVLALGVLALAAPAWAEDGAPADDASRPGVQTRWGGHLRLRNVAGWVEDDNLLALAGQGLVLDTAPEARLKLQVGPFGPEIQGGRLSLDLHAETVLRAGDTVSAGRELARLVQLVLQVVPEELAGQGTSALLTGFAGSTGGGGADEDATRLFDLTWVDEGSQYRLTGRIDRLSLTWRPDWGSVRVGRQALTWGNGLLFNPMDLFNPFSPSDVERDYKVGDDMVTVQMSDVAGGELQLLAVPRRDLATGDVEWNRSSVAVKLHRDLFGGLAGRLGGVGVDLLASRHYGETVLGAGATGTLGGAAWRTDVVWTALEDRPGRETRGDFVTAVANLDRAWIWGGRNWYGWVELYYDGLGNAEAIRALDDPALVERLARGELFTLGRRYADTSVNVELHPLVNLWATVLHNLDDDSGLLQPRLVWSAEENLEITLGADLYYGGRGTELGGLEVPGFPGAEHPPVVASPDRVYLWASLYF